MLIKLDENYQIGSDERQFILQEKKILGEDSKTPGEERIQNIGYYGTLEGVLRAYKERVIRLSDADSLNAIIKLVQSLDNKIDSILEGAK